MAPKQRYGCTVLIVCHTGLTDQKRVRGTIALTANTEAEYIVSRFDDVSTITRSRFKDCQPMPPLACRMEPVNLGRVDRYG